MSPCQGRKSVSVKGSRRPPGAIRPCRRAVGRRILDSTAVPAGTAADRGDERAMTELHRILHTMMMWLHQQGVFPPMEMDMGMM
ncbi:hypothetical protein Ntsu_34600 [Nocardia sp. IFM 10818]